jgi:hypothetical protein
MHQKQTAITLIAALALCICMACPSAQAQNIVLYDNGPLSTHSDNCSGQDASRVQTNLGLGIYGFLNRFSDQSPLADDFTVPSGGWNIESITFFAYQSSAPSSPSPMSGLYVQIRDGHPSDNESSIVWGDLSTNRLFDSFYTNIQRDLDTSQCTNQRYIFANTALVDTYLAPGTYWVEWMTEGSTSYSGPYAPPVSMLGQTTTGNALQGTLTNGSWKSIDDNGYYQGLPFIIMGPPCETNEDCDDGVFCNGLEECDNGTCSSPGDPCVGDELLCDEDSATCVECITDDNCTEGLYCDDGICRVQCEIFIRNKDLTAEQLLKKPRRRRLFISGGEDFDIYGHIDLGPIAWRKVKFNRKKNILRISAIFPFGLDPGFYPVMVGDCYGEIEIK